MEKKIFDDFARHCGRWLALAGHSALVSPSNETSLVNWALDSCSVVGFLKDCVYLRQ